MLSQNTFKILLSRVSSLLCVKLSLQWGGRRGEHEAFNIKEIPTQGFATLAYTNGSDMRTLCYQNLFNKQGSKYLPYS